VVRLGGTVRVAPVVGAWVVLTGVVGCTGALELVAEDGTAALVGGALVAREVAGPLTVVVEELTADRMIPATIRRATTDPRPIPMLRTMWRCFGAR